MCELHVSPCKRRLLIKLTLVKGIETQSKKQRQTQTLTQNL